jgi:hypothetical protein
MFCEKRWGKSEKKMPSAGMRKDRDIVFFFSKFPWQAFFHLKQMLQNR